MTKEWKHIEDRGGKIHEYGLKPGDYYTDLTYNEARGLEQTLMYGYHTLNGTKDSANPNVNFINGIGKNNKKAETYYNDALKYINRYPSYFENQVDNEINNIKEKMDYWWN